MSVVVFDFDGVIADSLDAAFEVRQLHDPNISLAEYLSHFEGNINDHKATKQQADDFDWFAHFGPRVPHLKPFPGIRDSVAAISQNNTLAIISSTTTKPIAAFLSNNDLSQYFDAVLGNDVSPSKVEKFKLAMKIYGQSPDQFVMITDTLGDLREAAEVNIKTIAVTWGFQNQTTLQKGNPAAIAKRPEELPQLVQNLLEV